MAEISEQANNDDLVFAARTDANALGQLYELYYERIFRFCVHRLFSKEVAEDVTSTVWLEVARRIRTFAGRTERDFRNWLYTIAANQANAYIRKTSRRERLLAEVARSMAPSGIGDTDDLHRPDWPRLYQAILRLRPKCQTIVILRFFENLNFDEIAQVLNASQTSVRVNLHRSLTKLRKHLKTVLEGDQ